MKREAEAGGRNGGFTLIEIVLTIALLGLLTGVFVLNISSMLRDTNIRSLENEYWRAIDSARSKAVYQQKPYTVEWLPKEAAFVVSSSGETERFELDTSEFDGAEVGALFEEIAPENSYVLIRGELVAKREVATVVFYPDGTCTPFTVELWVGDYVNRFQMDPWTGAQLVDPTADES